MARSGIGVGSPVETHYTTQQMADAYKEWLNVGEDVTKMKSALNQGIILSNQFYVTYLPFLSPQQVNKLGDVGSTQSPLTLLPGAIAFAGASVASGITAVEAGVGAGAASTAGKVASKIGSAVNPSTIAKGLGALTLTGLFTSIGIWKGLGLTLAGAILILIGLLQLSGIGPGQAARKVL